jgi:hypothetical protein
MCIDTREAAAAAGSQDSGVCGHVFLHADGKYLLALESNTPIIHVRRAARTKLLIYIPSTLGLTECHVQCLERLRKP